ncbi:hypothetical protein [Microbacterium maritypicum]|uniref:hypothetical protein n=1 Tax=Microbacterium maritypicum TaxID=33918 RepID=UPI001FF0A622|nr:hypothetical protein [Microbacterium liquefaciens]
MVGIRCFLETSDRRFGIDRCFVFGGEHGCAPGCLCLDERTSRIRKFRFDSVVVDHEDLREDRLIELAAHFVARVLVQLVRVLQQLKPAEDALNARRNIVEDSFEPLRDDLAFRFDFTNACRRSRRSKSACCNEVDEVVSLDFELVELVDEVTPKRLLNPLLVANDLIKTRFDSGDEVGRQSDGSVVIDDCVFDIVDRKVPRTAYAFLTSSAEEVEVLRFRATYSPLDDHATIHVTAFRITLSTPETSLEIALVDAASFTRVPGSVKEVLHLVEEVALDDRFMPTLKRLALVGCLTDVVAVTKEARHG